MQAGRAAAALGGSPSHELRCRSPWQCGFLMLFRSAVLLTAQDFVLLRDEFWVFIFSYFPLLKYFPFTEYFLSSFVLDTCQLSSSAGLKIISLNKINHDF